MERGIAYFSLTGVTDVLAGRCLPYGTARIPAILDFLVNSNSPLEVGIRARLDNDDHFLWHETFAFFAACANLRCRSASIDAAERFGANSICRFFSSFATCTRYVTYAI